MTVSVHFFLSIQLRESACRKPRFFLFWETPSFPPEPFQNPCSSDPLTPRRRRPRPSCRRCTSGWTPTCIMRFRRTGAHTRIIQEKRRVGGFRHTSSSKVWRCSAMWSRKKTMGDCRHSTHCKIYWFFSNLFKGFPCTFKKTTGTGPWFRACHHVFFPTDLHAGPFPQRHCEGGVPPAVAHRHDAVLKRITRIIYVF